MAQLTTGMIRPERRVCAAASFPTSQGAVIPPERAMTKTTLKAVPERAGNASPTRANVVGKIAAKPSPARTLASEANQSLGAVTRRQVVAKEMRALIRIRVSFLINLTRRVEASRPAIKAAQYPARTKDAVIWESPQYSWR